MQTREYTFSLKENGYKASLPTFLLKVNEINNLLPSHELLDVHYNMYHDEVSIKVKVNDQWTD